MVTVKKANLTDLNTLTKLFNLYRLFQKQPTDVEGARNFLEKRMKNNETEIYIAYLKNEAVGFTLLYPSYSSVAMQRSWILNDLYVEKLARKKGVANVLLEQVIEFTKETKVCGIVLETCNDNYIAQKLYEKFGFVKERNHFYYLSF